MKKGFTLVEVIIYIALVSFVLIALLEFIGVIFQARGKNMAWQELEDNGRLVLEKMRYAYFNEGNLDEFSLSNGRLYQDGVAITTGVIEVNNWSIIDLDDGVEVDLSLAHDFYDISLDFNDIFSQRP